MKLHNFITVNLLFVASSLLFSNCRTTKKASKISETKKLVETLPIDDKATPIIDHLSARVLSNRLINNQFNFVWLNTKFSASTNVDGKTNSFNASLRCRKDSALWISISLFGIEGARLLATCDSVKFIDRVNNKYFMGNYSFLSKAINTEIDFEMLQSVLIGNSVDFYDDDKLRTYIEEGNQVLSTTRKRKLKKVLNNTPEENLLKELVQRIWLDASTYKIKKNIINDFNTNRTFEGNYSNFHLVDSLLFPFTANFVIKAIREMRVDINYSKVEINNVQQMPFTIPAKYEPMKED